MKRSGSYDLFMERRKTIQQLARKRRRRWIGQGEDVCCREGSGGCLLYDCCVRALHGLGKNGEKVDGGLPTEVEPT